eukprot:XP_001704878.1 Hypothetical protein GL50803_37275 [Giardia lamblia ATCC 50803]
MITGDHVLWGVLDRLLVEPSDAAAITKGGNRGEGPAGAAPALVDNLGDAVRILLAEVKRLRHVVLIGKSATGCGALCVLKEGNRHKETRDLVLREPLEALRDARLPPGIQGLDVVKLGDRQGGRRESCSGEEKELHFKIGGKAWTKKTKNEIAFRTIQSDTQ